MRSWPTALRRRARSIPRRSCSAAAREERSQPFASPPSDELSHHEAAWRSKPLLRRLYRDWYRLVASRLSTVGGPTVELGSGIGRFKEVVPDTVLTDVVPTPYADAVVDAAALPYADGSLANIVLVDVFHHLARPGRFLDEAARTLAPGGRAVLLEPYCSPVSTLAYRNAHHEDVDLDADPFADDPALEASPWLANQALPTIAFFRRSDELARRWPALELAERRRLSLFVWILSGGFSRRGLAPVSLYRPLSAVERLLSPLLPVAAFRCLVVLARVNR
jgi:SAM-dependent methyltransferase